MKIDLTDREIELLMACIGTNIETIKRRPDSTDPMNAEMIEELFELETDLREAVNRQGDGWGDPDDPDLLMDPVDFAVKHDAETQMFNAGVEAREKMKATSRAAGRRALNLASPNADDRSEVQAVDVFTCEWNPSDPKNW